MLKTAIEHNFSHPAIICGTPRIYQPIELKISVPNLHPKKFLMKSVTADTQTIVILEA